MICTRTDAVLWLEGICRDPELRQGNVSISLSHFWLDSELEEDNDGHGGE
jgi:hypothetical protein